MEVENGNSTMSREIQERADRIMRELRDALIPIKEEIKAIKSGSGKSK